LNIPPCKGGMKGIISELMVRTTHYAFFQADFVGLRFANPTN